MFHDYTLPSFSVGPNDVHIDIGLIPPKGKVIPVYTMKTFRGSTVTIAIICNISRK